MFFPFLEKNPSHLVHILESGSQAIRRSRTLQISWKPRPILEISKSIFMQCPHSSHLIILSVCSIEARESECRAIVALAEKRTLSFNILFADVNSPPSQLLCVYWPRLSQSKCWTYTCLCVCRVEARRYLSHIFREYQLSARLDV